MRPQSRNSFRIAIICALALEFDAVEDSFDERYTFTDYGKQCGDANFYRPGRIGKHNIVLVCLPEIGKRNAASIASALKISFAKIELTLLVGICGGVPFPSRDTEIILGDVIISTRVIEYDLGKQYPGGFQIKGRFIDTIGRADRDIRSILSLLKTRRIKDEFQERHQRHHMDLQNSRNTWQYPGVAKDRLFKTEYLHKHHDQALKTSHVCAPCRSNQDSICDEALESDCDVLGCTGESVQRDRLNESNPRPRIHQGSFASGDTVMKSAEHRDKLFEQTKVSGFEMEGAAICDNLRCVIIKGVSDYSDSHKNNIWQNYAAATAASCAKAFLEVLPATIPEDLSYLPIGPRPLRARDEQFHESSHIMEDTLREESNYQCKISSMTSSIDNMDHHIMSLQKEERRLENTTNPFFREVLVSALADTIRKNSNTSKNSKKTRYFNNSLTKLKFGTIISQTQKVRHTITIDDESSTQYKTTTSLIFYPASWLMKIGLTYAMTATATNKRSGWKYSISPVRAVQNDSLIFRFCESGNVDAVRELFKRGEASVMDINADGWRPLHFATFHGHFDLAKFLISQHADQAALVYKSEISHCFTPASFIDTTATSAIEMMLLFDDSINFHGPQSDGWGILWSRDWIGCHESYNGQVIDVLSFLIHKYRIDIPDYVDTHTLDYCLISVIHFPSVECLRLIMDSKLEETQDFIFDEPAFFYIARQPNVHMDISQFYFDRGTDVHKVYRGETAFSLSLWLSILSSKWCDRLKDNGQDPNDFIIRDTSPGSVLALVNWRTDTLTDLLAITSKIKIELFDVDGNFDNIRCDECGKIGDYLLDEPMAVIEPWWEDLKYRMKTEQCICSLLPTQCACGKYLESCATESSVGLKVHAYGGLYNYSLCRFCEKLYSEKSFEAREDDQAIPDADGVNSNGAYNENMTTSWMRYGQVIGSLRLFHLQNSRWYGQYHPGEYYCSPCLALREQLYLDLTASAARS